MNRKGFRDGIAPKDLIQSMTKEDWDRIREQKEFDSVQAGTREYDIALYCDQMRLQIRKLKADLTKRLWNIKNIHNRILRLQLQITTGNITEVLKDGVTMTQSEVETDIQLNQWMAEGESFEIPQMLGKLRAYVGHHDIAKNVVLKKEDFETYANDILEELAALGYVPLTERS